jgi:hypothetical protein
VEEGPERELVGPHLIGLVEQRDALNGVLSKLVSYRESNEITFRADL